MFAPIRLKKAYADFLLKKQNNFEGKCSHLYLDTANYMTIGIGHLLVDELAVMNLLIGNSQNSVPACHFYEVNDIAKKPLNSFSMATKIKLQGDYQAINRLKPNSNRTASYFASFCQLRMCEVDIMQLFYSDIDRVFSQRVNNHFEDFSLYPLGVQLAILDIAFNAKNFPLGFPKFYQAIKKRDWALAAQESHRQEISAQRNQQIWLLFKQAQAPKSDNPTHFPKAKNDTSWPSFLPQDLPSSKKNEKLTIKIEGFDNIQITHFNGEEAIDQLFQFCAMINLQDSYIDFGKIINKNVTVYFNSSEKMTHYFNGVIGRIIQSKFQNGWRNALVVIVPKLWLLSDVIEYSVFIQKTALDIILELAKRFMVEICVKGISKKIAIRNICIQYHESIWHFICRLLQEEGIFYFFSHEDGRHIWHLVDSLDVTHFTEMFLDISSGLVSYFKQLTHLFGEQKNHITCVSVVLLRIAQKLEMLLDSVCKKTIHCMIKQVKIFIGFDPKIADYTGRFLLHAIESGTIIHKTPNHPKIMGLGIQSARVCKSEPNFPLKIYFHWQSVSSEPCDVNIAQPWLVQNQGWKFYPRQNHEVIVGITDENSAMPVILASVYNGKNKSPYSLPDHGTRSGFKTLQGNELYFDDQKEREILSWYAPNNFVMEVENDAMIIVENGSHNVCAMQGKIIFTAAQQIDLCVGENTLSVNQAGVFVNNVLIQNCIR